jgi:hypothetical protein
MGRAERDYASLPRTGGTRLAGTLSLGILALTVALLAALALLRPPATPNTGSDVLSLGSDGLPVAIGGDSVLRGAEIGERLSIAPGPFLAGGRLVLRGTECSPPTDSPDDPCPGDWWLEDVSGNDADYPLLRLARGADFVHTSRALTVFRVSTADAAGLRCGPMCPNALVVLDVPWRQPTKGPIPDEATPPGGGETIAALVPDFVSAYGQDEETIAGYIPKEYLLRTTEVVVPGTPDNPPQDEPFPVYGEDLATLVGYHVPGQGFVPLEASSAVGRERAIEIALAEAAPGTSVVSATSGTLGRIGDPNVLPDEPRDREVWAVVLRGQFSGSCPMPATGDPVCPPDATSMLVVLDFHTGAFVYSTAPAP